MASDDVVALNTKAVLRLAQAVEMLILAILPPEDEDGSTSLGESAR